MTGALPSGTVTFLFTDIEGSTRLWELDAEQMEEALATHDATLTDVIRRHDGFVFKHTGDGVCSAFSSADRAVAAAITSQRLLDLPVRMGVHTGEVVERDGDYFGRPLNRAARVMDAAHGGQIIVSSSTAALVDRGSLMGLGQHRLRDLAAPEELWQVRAAGLAETFPAPRTIGSFQSNLPALRSSFIGRVAEVDAVSEALAASRLVTLTGVGGVGKTRLALQVGAEVLPSFADGVWFCELATARGESAMIDTILAALGIDQQPGMSPDDGLLAALRLRRCLLVLDNCEHLVDAVAGLVERILDTSPQVVVLATSREALAVDGERMITVPSLGTDGDTPDELAPAIELFVDRASNAVESFVFDDGNADAVRELCRRVDGIPLAIELAAARVTMLTPAEIVDRLEDRFRLLAGGRHRERDRHQTLRRTVDWSHDLLDAHAQTALRRLTVFAGSFDLDAAEAVASLGDHPNDMFDAVSELVSKSMLVAEPIGPSTRYRFLETLRQYGHDRLQEAGELAEATGACAEYLTDWAAVASAQLLGDDHQTWLTDIELQLPNVRRALEVAVDSDDRETAFALIAPFHCHVLGPSTLFTKLATSALRQLSWRNHPLAPAVLTLSAENCLERGELERAAALADAADETAAELGIDPLTSTAVLRATVLPGLGDPHAAHREAVRAADLANRSGEAHLLAAAQLHMISIGEALGLLTNDESIEAARGLVEFASGLMNPTARAQAYWTLGNALTETAPEEALEHFIACLAESVGGRVEAAGAIYSAKIHIQSGRPDDAFALLAAPMATWRLDDVRTHLEVGFVVIADAIADQHPEDAARLLGTARHNGDVAFYVPDVLERAMASVTERLGADHAEQVMAAAEAADFDELTNLAMRVIGESLTGGAE